MLTDAICVYVCGLIGQPRLETKPQGQIVPSEIHTTYFTFTVFKRWCYRVYARTPGCLARRNLLPGRAGRDVGPPPIAIAIAVSPSPSSHGTGGENSLLDVGELVGLEEVDVLDLEERAVREVEEIDDGHLLHARSER